jgi:glycosyltransferase involved in cell wall biosynthesis
MANEQPIRVLQVVDSLDRGGIETWLVRVLRHIDRDEFAMDFLVTSSRPFAYAEEITSLGSKILPCLDRSVASFFTGPLPWLGSRWVRDYARRLGQLLRESGPYAIVHSHFDPCALPLWCARREGVPVRVAHSHTSQEEFLYRGRLGRAVLSSVARRWLRANATLGLAVSQSAAQAKFGTDWNSDQRWQVLHPGIDPAPFRIPADRAKVGAELGIPPGARVVGHVGRFQEEKNHAFLIDLLAAASRESRLHLLLVGEGRLRGEVERALARAGLKGSVTIVGARPDVPRLMLAAMDVFVFPSRHEGLGLAVIEAQAAGLPCLISDTLPEEIDVVPSLVTRMSLSRPASEWARTALALASRPPAVPQCVALACIEQGNFNIQNTVARLQELYRTAVRSGG